MCPRMQKTVREAISFSGKGLFTGLSTEVRLLPAPPHHGLVFYRSDLPERPAVPAQLQAVLDTERSTRLAQGDVKIGLVEHLLSSLYACEIDNACIEVSGPEIPICDGSARLFIDLIDQAGTVEQEAEGRDLIIQEPLFWSEGESVLVALPFDGLRISYTLHYPHSSFLKSQFFSLNLDRETYRREIAPCRTFALYEEIAPLVASGFLQGGALESGLVIKDGALLNPEGARFEDEMVRHKILDLLGDLSLLGRRLKAHIVALRSGHKSNVAFAKMLETCICRL